MYNAPLPGIGWTNTSVFSKWRSLFYRAATINVSTAGANCSHWARAASYAQPTGAVISMFHDKLWGGWHFVVDNVTQATAASVAFNLAYGGYQEAQGPQTSNGVNSFYVRVVGDVLVGAVVDVAHPATFLRRSRMSSRSWTYRGSGSTTLRAACCTCSPTRACLPLKPPSWTCQCWTPSSS